jgi:hypothetical protein
VSRSCNVEPNCRPDLKHLHGLLKPDAPLDMESICWNFRLYTMAVAFDPSDPHLTRWYYHNQRLCFVSVRFVHGQRNFIFVVYRYYSHLRLVLICKKCHISWVLTTVLSFFQSYSSLQEEHFSYLHVTFLHSLSSLTSWTRSTQMNYKNCPSTQCVHDHKEVLTVLLQFLQFCLFLQSQTDSLVPCSVHCKQEKTKHSWS